MIEPKWILCLTRQAQDGEESMLQISEDSIWRPILCTGLEGVFAENLFSPYANRVGAQFRKCAIAHREITLTFGTQEAVDAVLREKLIRFFRPGEKGTLSLDRGTGVRYIDYYMGGVEFSQETLYAPLRVKVVLSCPSPWFYGEERQAGTFDQILPLLTFPFFSFAKKGVTGGVKTRRSECTVKNDGDLEAGFNAVLRVWGGQAESLTLSLGDRKIVLCQSLMPGDEVEISTLAGEKYIRVNGERAQFLRESEFFSIPHGRATIRIGFDSAQSETAVEGTILYRPLYLGA